jgi:transcriptional regulator with XRE-family HTH domain
MGIGKTLSAILDEKGTNPNELAEKTKIAPTTIYSIIKRDNTKVDIEVLIKICRALNVDIERFYQEYMTESELKAKQPDKLKYNEQRLLDLFRQLDEVQQNMILERAQTLVDLNNEYKEEGSG